MAHATDNDQEFRKQADQQSDRQSVPPLPHDSDQTVARIPHDVHGSSYFSPTTQFYNGKPGKG